jgi:hypothetical protein
VIYVTKPDVPKHYRGKGFDKLRIDGSAEVAAFLLGPYCLEVRVLYHRVYVVALDRYVCGWV